MRHSTDSVHRHNQNRTEVNSRRKSHAGLRLWLVSYWTESPTDDCAHKMLPPSWPETQHIAPHLLHTSSEFYFPTSLTPTYTFHHKTCSLPYIPLSRSSLPNLPRVQLPLPLFVAGVKTLRNSTSLSFVRDSLSGSRPSKPSVQYSTGSKAWVCGLLVSFFTRLTLKYPLTTGGFRKNEAVENACAPTSRTSGHN